MFVKVVLGILGVGIGVCKVDGSGVVCGRLFDSVLEFLFLLLIWLIDVFWSK